MADFIKSTWQPHKEDETKITFSKDYHDLCKVARVDHLMDTIRELEQVLEEALKEPYGYSKQK